MVRQVNLIFIKPSMATLRPINPPDASGDDIPRTIIPTLAAPYHMRWGEVIWITTPNTMAVTLQDVLA
jgi:hypothetical protein